jgi:hypothetical protein
MTILDEIIKGMNKEQVRFYKLFASRTNKDADRKDIALFDYIRKNGENKTENRIFNRLYNNEEEKNSYYRLKNRLLQDLLKSLSVQHFSDDDAIYVMHLLALARFFFTKNELPIAKYLLKKAETKALQIEAYELLDIIYTDYIKLSHELVSINPEKYIEKRKSNQTNIKLVREIDDILAAVSYRLKITQNFSLNKNPILDVLEKTVDDFTQDKELKQSAKLRFKIYDAVSQVLLQRRDYKTMEDYLLKTYAAFENEKLFNKESHNTKLQMLTYIVNTLFKNNKLKESLSYAEKLKQSIDEFHQMLYDKYIFFYYNSLVINYSKLNPSKAISILEDLKDNEKIKSSSYYQLFVYLNLAVLYFDKHEYKTSIRNLVKLYLLDGYKETDISLRLKIAIAELIIRYELGDEDVLKSKIEQVRKDFGGLIHQSDYRADLDLLVILEQMIQDTRRKLRGRIIASVSAFMKTTTVSNHEDTEIINYSAWLKEKFPAIALNR